MKPNAAEITRLKFRDSQLIKLRSIGFTLNVLYFKNESLLELWSLAICIQTELISQ
jgi:hypothetical protein